jgi:hypothetical protein
MEEKIKKIINRIFISEVFLVVVFLIVFIFPQNLFSDNWLKVDVPEGYSVWVDTSHWVNSAVWVNDGYYRDATNKRWVDSSYVVSQGYWESGEYKVWIDSWRFDPYTAYRYVDSSHYETRYRDVEVLSLANFTIIEGTTSYGWSVYSFAAKPQGLQLVTYNGEKYIAEKYVIDYKPSRGGWIYAVKWVYIRKYVKVREDYLQWVSSGYWQAYTAYRLIDQSHWDTRTGGYRVAQGYWEEYKDREWVDTSHYENVKKWITDGYFTEPIHGEVAVEKNPKYIFTKWHKDSQGNDCSMDLKVSWKLFNPETGMPDVINKIDRVYIYEEVYRYKEKGTNKVEIFNSQVLESSQGSVEATATFDFAGGIESILHVYLYSTGGAVAHVYFSNPINGYRSINIKKEGTVSDANEWLGGNDFGKVEF